MVKIDYEKLLDKCRKNLADAESKRDAAWEELRNIRQAISADENESTFDEVERAMHERDDERDTLAARLAAVEAAGREAETLLTNYLVNEKFPHGSDCEEVRDMLHAALSAAPQAAPDPVREVLADIELERDMYNDVYKNLREVAERMLVALENAGDGHSLACSRMSGQMCDCWQRDRLNCIEAARALGIGRETKEE